MLEVQLEAAGGSVPVPASPADVPHMMVDDEGVEEGHNCNIDDVVVVAVVLVQYYCLWSREYDCCYNLCDCAMLMSVSLLLFP